MKKLCGFGLGPIQTGLILFEAQKSGEFDSYTVAEISPELVNSVKKNNYKIWINIAHLDGIEHFELSCIEVLNPQEESDAKLLVKRIKEADELSTAVPSVEFYDKPPASIAKVLSNLEEDKPRILYACENHNFAAEILSSKISVYSPPPNNLQFLNTVIGKMSGVVSDPSIIKKLKLKPITPDLEKAILVEEFNHILISKIKLPNYQKSIKVFEEKEDLLPFEEAKLYGHNAIHSLLGYLAAERGYKIMSEIKKDNELINIAQKAFIEESGKPLIKKYSYTKEPLFTPEGYSYYANDLIRRMLNPWLHDTVERVCRDPVRKLGENDRLIGTMKLALTYGITPRLLAKGAASAVRYLCKSINSINGYSLPSPSSLNKKNVEEILMTIWKRSSIDEILKTCLSLICENFPS